MNEQQAAMMHRLQQLGLTMDDLREYLDTHSEDSFALQRFNDTAAAYQELMQNWNTTYGPLTQRCMNEQDSGWQWGGQDFPWNY